MFITIRESDNFVLSCSNEVPELEEGQFYIWDSFNFEPSLEDAQWRYLGDHKFELRYMKDGSDLNSLQYTYSEFMNIIGYKNIGHLLQYKTIKDGYKIWAYDDSQYFYCKINTIDNTNDIIDFEENFKDDANKKLLSKESATNWLKVRSRKASGDIYLNWIYFTTGDENSFDNGGDGDYTILATSTKTIIDFNPSYDYELEGGMIRTIGDITSNSIKASLVFAPDIPKEMGGSECPINNVKFDNEKKYYEMRTDVKLIKYRSDVPIANKARLELTHSVEDSINFEFCLYIFRI